MKKNLIAILLLLVGVAGVANAQGRRGLRINEVMVQNDSSIIDDFGRRSAWIELYNSTFAPLEISSVYLTNDKNQPKMYPVPGKHKTNSPTQVEKKVALKKTTFIFFYFNFYCKN